MRFVVPHRPCGCHSRVSRKTQLETHTGESPTNTVALHQDVSWQAFLTAEPRGSWLADTLPRHSVTVTVDRALGVTVTLLTAATCCSRVAVIAHGAPTEKRIEGIDRAVCTNQEYIHQLCPEAIVVLFAKGNAEHTLTLGDLAMGYQCAPHICTKVQNL